MQGDCYKDGINERLGQRVEGYTESGTAALLHWLVGSTATSQLLGM